MVSYIRLPGCLAYPGLWVLLWTPGRHSAGTYLKSEQSMVARRTCIPFSSVSNCVSGLPTASATRALRELALLASKNFGTESSYIRGNQLYLEELMLFWFKKGVCVSIDKTRFVLVKKLCTELIYCHQWIVHIRLWLAGGRNNASGAYCTIRARFEISHSCSIKRSHHLGRRP